MYKRQPFLVSILVPQEGSEANYEAPSPRSFGGMLPYMLFAAILTVLHHLWLFLLQSWQWGSPGYLLLKTLLSAVVSLVLIFILELIFPRKQRYRTNT